MTALAKLDGPTSRFGTTAFRGRARHLSQAGLLYNPQAVTWDDSMLSCVSYETRGPTASRATMFAMSCQMRICAGLYFMGYCSPSSSYEIHCSFSRSIFYLQVLNPLPVWIIATQLLPLVCTWPPHDSLPIHDWTISVALTP